MFFLSFWHVAHFVIPLPSLSLTFTLVCLVLLFPPVSVLCHNFLHSFFSVSPSLSWILCHRRGDEEDWPLVLAVSYHYLWERDQRKKEAGSKTEIYSDHYLIPVCVCVFLCVGGCGYSRVNSESRGKFGSSTCIVLT